MSLLHHHLPLPLKRSTSTPATHDVCDKASETSKTTFMPRNTLNLQLWSCTQCGRANLRMNETCCSAGYAAQRDSLWNTQGATLRVRKVKINNIWKCHHCGKCQYIRKSVRAHEDPDNAICQGQTCRHPKCRDCTVLDHIPAQTFWKCCDCESPHHNPNPPFGDRGTDVEYRQCLINRTSRHKDAHGRTVLFQHPCNHWKCTDCLPKKNAR